MPSLAMPQRTADELTRINRGFYESLWNSSSLIDPSRFNTWPMVRELAMASPRRLEVAPGLRPRLPLEGTYFIDLSPAAASGLRARGASAVCGTVSALPCPDAGFDLICALDVLEHVVDDAQALSELSRVAAPDARLLLSVPLHPAAWTAFDDAVGHYRRYEPERITRLLAAHGWSIERSAIYGMQPSSPALLSLGEWFLTHQRERALWWYEHVFMPLGLRLQKPLHWRPGLGETDRVDEVLLLCRRT